MCGRARYDLSNDLLDRSRNEEQPKINWYNVYTALNSQKMDYGLQIFTFAHQYIDARYYRDNHIQEQVGKYEYRFL